MLVKEIPPKYYLSNLNTVSIVLMSRWHTVSPVQFQLDPSDIITSGPTTMNVSKSKWCRGMGVAGAIHHTILTTSHGAKSTLHIRMKLQKCWKEEKIAGKAKQQQMREHLHYKKYVSIKKGKTKTRNNRYSTFKKNIWICFPLFFTHVSVFYSCSVKGLYVNYTSL